MSLITTMYQLAELRRECEALRAELDVAQRAIEDTAEYRIAAEAHAKLSSKEEEVRRTEELVRHYAIGAWEQSGDEHPAPGVMVYRFFTVQYDHQRALAWCREHAPAFIRQVLDTKTFEKVAWDLPGAPVERVVTGRAYIDQDISAYLADLLAIKEQVEAKGATPEV